MKRCVSISSFLFAVFTLSSLPMASAQVFYSNNFDDPEYVHPAAIAALTGGANDPTNSPYDATFGNIYRGDSNATPISLQLTSLPVHTGVDIDFVLAFLESWDSYDGSCCTPDNLDVYIDGNLAATLTYNNATGNIKDIDAGSLLLEYVQINSNGYFSDTVVDMRGDPTYSFAHTGSTLTLSLIASGIGWQGGGDEAYAIDNLTVSLSGVVVPEPTTSVLLALSVAALSMRRR